MSPDANMTVLLRAWAQGNESALDRLAPRVYSELHRIAHGCMRNELAGNSLQTTALVNEAWLRLIDIKAMAFKDRVHFFALSAQMMRRILVDAARGRASGKRGGGKRANHSTAIDLDAIPDVKSERDRELIALDDALGELQKMDPRKVRVIELRYFGGLSVEETAEALKISPQSVMRDWRLAKSWLLREISRASGE